MVHKHIPAVFGVNKYLWHQIESEGILDKANYGDMIPIIPVQEQPGFIQAMEERPGIGQFPYIVYSWYSNGIDSDTWYRQTDTVVYNIYSTDAKKLRELVLLTVDHLKRYDDSAQAVGQYLAGVVGLNDEYLDYDYKTIWVAATTAGTPSSYENNPNRASVTVRITYTDDANDRPAGALKP